MPKESLLIERNGMGTVRLFQDANALDSLRNSDFDAVSAYGEVVDNSIEAGARNIRIKFITSEAGHGYQVIDKLAFGDDGDGMNANTLHNCLQIGWSSRYNDRTGIGRFGVGMTMAAIHECKRVDVWSKQTRSEWLHTAIDLVKIERGEEETIPDPTPKALPKEFEGLVGESSGTLVVWSKYDRQEANAAKLIDDTIVWMGRTYRYFIWEDGVRIFVNGQVVQVIDPLYARTEDTRFPGDPAAEVFTPIVIDWKVDSLDTPANAPETATIVVRTSLLPKEFRASQGSGGTKEAMDRFIHMNEGVSILRARREVFYGPIPYWNAAGKGWPRFEEIDRWWGCEISFDPILDRAFTVKNIKRGAVPETELKKALHEKIKPTRETVLERVRELWKANKLARDQDESVEDVPRAGDHTDAERAAKNTQTDKSRIDEHKDFEAEADKLTQRYKDRYDEQQRQKLKELFRAQPFTIMEADWRGPQLFEVNHLGGSAVLEYNKRHLFWEQVYGRIEGLESGGDNYDAARDIKALLDLLLMSYGKAETRFDADESIRAGDLLDQLRSNLGQYLQNYVRTWQGEE
jgi:hypothetical protein